MKLPPAIKWIALALLGLLIAVGVAFASTNLVSQEIGISSESIRAGDALAPVVGGAKGQQPSHEQQGSTAKGGGGEPTTTTAPSTGSELPSKVPTEAEPAEPRDDSGGRNGSGGGEGADD